MLTVAQLRDRAAKLAWRELRGWAVDGGADAALDVPLHPPTERGAFADQAAAIEWARSWDDIEGVTWETRQWSSMGSQRLPVRCTVRGADAICRVAGRAIERDWVRLRSRVMAFGERFEPTGRIDSGGSVGAALRRTGGAVLALDDADFERLLDVLDWLRDHPESGRRIRQLPIRGVDTKWVGSHSGLVSGLHLALTGTESLGLTVDDVRVRIRILDPALRMPFTGALSDITAPIAELATAPLYPSRVLVVENLETLLALGELTGTVAIFGGGFGAGHRLKTLAWATDAAVDVRYWGDLDSHGFAILDELRASVAVARSVLMDRETLLAHRDLWVPEPRPSTARLTRLTDDERDALETLWAEGNPRLEQERVPWEWAEKALEADDR